MKVSAFLRQCAERLDKGLEVDRVNAPQGWARYIVDTLPQECDPVKMDAVAETRVMRFLLASEIAKAEGR